jgi:heme O synthase-like polyprenyltransferase
MNKLILAKTKNPLKKEEQSEDDNYSYFDLLDCRIIQATMILGLAGMFYTMSNSSISFALPGLNL